MLILKTDGPLTSVPERAFPEELQMPISR